MALPFDNTRRLQVFACAISAVLFFSFAAICIQIGSGAYAADLGNTADEAAHFVSGAMIRDYISNSGISSPLVFAFNYYEHFPRVAIGHWPPFFYSVEALIFLIGGTTTTSALIFEASIAGSCAAVMAILIGRRTHALAGIAAGLALLMIQPVTYLFCTVMLDNMVGLLVLLSATLWAAYARSGRLAWAMAFSVCASCAILTKGNAYGLAFLPLLYALFSRRPGILLSRNSWIAGGIVILLTVPWYLLTYRLASDGFNYSWGSAYSITAFRLFSGTLPAILGVVGIAAFLLGVLLAVSRAWSGECDELMLAVSAAAAGMFVFQCIVPVDLTPRYMIDLLPAALVAAALGLDAVIRRLWPMAPRAVRSGAVAAMILINASWHFPPLRLSSLDMDSVARAIVSAKDDSPLVMISGSANGEGALIGALAEDDRAETHYVVRGTKALGSGDFMAHGYQQRFESGGDIERWIEQNRIGWLVITTTSPLPTRMAHEYQMTDLAAAPPAAWHLVFEANTPSGTTKLFRVDTPAPSENEIRTLLGQLDAKRMLGSQ
jgi:hypothetical protein